VWRYFDLIFQVSCVFFLILSFHFS
jgi:hypothetical protein